MRREVKRVEVAVLLAVLGLVLALGVTGVQKMREAGARAGCAQNMRQLGVAIRTYNTQYEHFPAGTMPNPARTPADR